jgi:hypothetical protein
LRHFGDQITKVNVGFGEGIPENWPASISPLLLWQADIAIQQRRSLAAKFLRRRHVFFAL